MLRVARVPIRRITRVVAVLAAASVAACFTKPDAPHAGDGGTDPDGRTATDSTGSDAQTPACTNQPTDTFDTGTSCGAIGSAYGPGGVVSRANNELVMEPTGSGAGCSSLTAFSFANGTSIKIAQAATSGMSNTTTFTAYNAANATEGMQVIINSTGFGSIVYEVQCLGGPSNTVEQNYDPAVQAYWKFEVPAAATGTSVHAYFSPTGSQWTDTGVSCMWTSVANVKVDVGVGSTADPSSQPALFDDFNIKTCRP